MFDAIACTRHISIRTVGGSLICIIDDPSTVKQTKDKLGLRLTVRRQWSSVGSRSLFPHCRGNLRPACQRYLIIVINRDVITGRKHCRRKIAEVACKLTILLVIPRRIFLNSTRRRLKDFPAEKNFVRKMLVTLVT